ncbi:hypothetical protein GYMLUDRAFT_62045 [Collybiopsis luxurians FD-317 M1]|uniref:Uncharacterized protein n=1 Tax=Collybiopsis luxurians FD-317 M1 TaxID=944289 RepID=A0A0D0C276_9AGAR|nr:hypothetical protein GYMLUDRAFT_62045 [Collybiopsis luxurians FD-317 M1]
MARSPGKTSRKKAGTQAPTKSPAKKSPRKTSSRRTSSKNISKSQSSVNKHVSNPSNGKSRRCRKCAGSPLLTSPECAHSKIYGAMVQLLTNADVQVPLGASFAQLQQLEQHLQNGGPLPVQIIDVQPEDTGGSVANESLTGAPASSFSQLVAQHTPPNVFHTPIRPNGRTVSPPGPFSSVIASEYAIEVSHSAPNPLDFEGVDSETGTTRRSPLPPSSPPRDLSAVPTAQSSPMAGSSSTNSSSPMMSSSSDVQSSPASSAVLSSPLKARRARATQKDPLHGRVKGAARGSLPWSIVRDKAIPATRNEVSESTRRFRCEIKKIICCHIH